MSVLLLRSQGRDRPVAEPLAGMFVGRCAARGATLEPVEKDCEPA